MNKLLEFSNKNDFYICFLLLMYDNGTSDMQYDFDRWPVKWLKNLSQDGGCYLMYQTKTKWMQDKLLPIRINILFLFY